MNRNFLLAGVLACLAAGMAQAQTTVEVRDAELSVPFGAAAGHLVLAGDYVIFIDADQRDASFAIDRANMASLDQDGQMFTITTRSPIRDRSGARSQLRFRLSDETALRNWYDMTRTPSPAPAPAPTAPAATEVVASFQARHDHRIGECRGRLIITADKLAYESVSDIGDSRQWVFADIKEIKQDGPYKLEIKPFIGKTFNLELIGTGLDSQQYRMLVDRVTTARMSS